MWLFYNRRYMLTQKCSLLYIKASMEDTKYLLNTGYIKRHRLSCCLLRLECTLSESELFTDRLIKLMMLFSVLDMKQMIPYFIHSYR
jgi:hypothetical protein